MEKKLGADFSELRRRAEERLAKKLEARPDLASVYADKDVKALVHELGTYEIELEMQNDELRRAHEELYASRSKYADLYDFAPIGYFTLDPDGRISDTNLTGARMFGLGKKSVTGSLFSAFVYADSQEEFRKHLVSTLKTRTRSSTELKMVGTSGNNFTVQLQSIAADTGGGHTTHIRTTVSDISELRKAQKERADWMKREEDARIEVEGLRVQRLENLRVMAGGIAHDLNNLMVAVQVNAELALLKLTPDHPAHEFVAGIEKATEKISNLSKQILTYAGKNAIKKEAISINDTARNMAHLLMAAISKKAVIEYDLAKGLPPVEADAQSIQQVVLNLILNASDAIGDEKGTIKISSGTMYADREYLDSIHLGHDIPEGNYIYFEIADTGAGMTEEVKNKIFEPFYSTKFTGRGLGLPSVFGIIKAHEGAIDVRSEVGKGSTFRVLVPVPERPASLPEGKPLSRDLKKGTGTILVVDDDDSVLDMTKTVLENAGYTVLTAEDGPEGLSVYRENKDSISAVILDLIMPTMRGDEVTREILNIREDANIILLSGYHDLELEKLFTGRGKIAVIQKPYKVDTLLEKVHEITE